MPDPLLTIILLLILIIFNALLNSSEMALVSFSRTKLIVPEDIDPAKKVVLDKLHSKCENFAPATRSCVSFISFIAAAISVFTFAPTLANLFIFTGISHDVLLVISVFVVAILTSFMFLVFGELLPKNLAMRNPQDFVLKHSSSLITLYTVLKPLSFVTISFTKLLLKPFGGYKKRFDNSTFEDEILMMLENGNKKGSITSNTSEMIKGIFEFDDTIISDIMTHRTDMNAIEDLSDLSDTVDMAITTGHSRIPVFHEDIDNIVGIVYVKDLLKYVCSTVPEKFKITDIMRVPLFVPRTKLCSELFSEMRDSKSQIAIVVDEYGGTEGLVTIEDLVEEIFGNIQDEYDNEDDEVQKLNETTFTVDGATSIDELSNLMEVNIPDGDYDTISGLIIENLGYIPKSGEHPSVDILNLTLTVSQVDNRRISKVLVVKH